MTLSSSSCAAAGNLLTGLQATVQFAQSSTLGDTIRQSAAYKCAAKQGRLAEIERDALRSGNQRIAPISTATAR